MSPLSYIIVTARPESMPYAVSEWQRYDPSARPVRDLAPGVKLMALPVGWERFTIDAPGFVFTRHVFPVGYAKQGGDIGDTDELLNAVKIPPGTLYDAWTFSVQARGDVPNELITDLENHIIQRGFEKDKKHPDWVLSVYAHNNNGEVGFYAGASFAVHNRSRWNGDFPCGV
jgi:hypothetical protein